MVEEFVQEISDGADRATALTRQLLAFSRRQILELEDVNLNEVIQGIVKMVKRVIGENIHVELLEGHQLDTVHVDRGQIEQVLLNLCVNARDAMPEGGSIVIETENVFFDDEYCKEHAWASAGRYVLLSVTDSGCGMDQETLAHVFEPFFHDQDSGQRDRSRFVHRIWHHPSA